jgi:hypothetical protein
MASTSRRSSKTSGARIFAQAGFSIEKVTTGLGDVLGGPQTYGHGPYALNYWLRPAKG